MSQQSNNHTGGSPTFHMKVTKVADNLYEATCPTQPKVASGQGPTETQAIRNLTSNINLAVANNTLKKG